MQDWPNWPYLVSPLLAISAFTWIAAVLTFMFMKFSKGFHFFCKNSSYYSCSLLDEINTRPGLRLESSLQKEAVAQWRDREMGIYLEVKTAEFKNLHRSGSLWSAWQWGKTQSWKAKILWCPLLPTAVSISLMSGFKWALLVVLTLKSRKFLPKFVFAMVQSQYECGLDYCVQPLKGMEVMAFWKGHVCDPFVGKVYQRVSAGYTNLTDLSDFTLGKCL